MEEFTLVEEKLRKSFDEYEIAIKTGNDKMKNLRLSTIEFSECLYYFDYAPCFEDFMKLHEVKYKSVRDDSIACLTNLSALDEKKNALLEEMRNLLKTRLTQAKNSIKEKQEEFLKFYNYSNRSCISNFILEGEKKASEEEPSFEIEKRNEQEENSDAAWK